MCNERVHLKPARGPAPRAERHVAVNDGHGQHRAESCPCQQKNGGTRVEEGQRRPVCANEHGHSNVVPAQPVFEQNASVVDAGVGQAGAGLVDAPRQSTRTSPGAVTARVMKCK